MVCKNAPNSRSGEIGSRDRTISFEKQSERFTLLGFAGARLGMPSNG
jgi:hypothetical protein